MYLVLKSENGSELERFKTKAKAESVCDYYRKYFPNCCVKEEE